MGEGIQYVQPAGQAAHSQHTVMASGAQPWHLAGYAFIAVGMALAAFAATGYVMNRMRDWRANRPERSATPAEFAAALGDAENVRLLRVAALLKPYAVELDAEKVVVRLAGIDTPAASAPWTAAAGNSGQGDGSSSAAGDDRVRSAPRDRLADAAEADEHPFIALGVRGTVVVFVDPTHSPGLITVDGPRGSANELVEILGRQSQTAGHNVRFEAVPADGAQWRWTLASDGMLDTDVLGVRVQTRDLATALKAAESRSTGAGETRDDPEAAAPAPAQADPGTTSSLVGRLTATATASSKVPALATTTSAKALALALANTVPTGSQPALGLDAVSAAEPAGSASPADPADPAGSANPADLE